MTFEDRTDHSLMSDLVERCITLCADVEPKLSKLTPHNESFLTHSLEDTLAQLEVILRAFSDSQEGTTSEERQSLFKRIFSRGEEAIDGTDQDFELPEFDVTTQGLQGNAITVPLAELMGFLAFGSKTGVLIVDSPDENFLLGIRDGNLLHASSDRTPEGLRLGEVLVGLGYLTRRQLERFLAKHDKNGEDVSGEMLLESGMICDEELQGALEHQVRQLFFRLVNTKNALFRFREGMHVSLAFQVSLPINQLILESAQALDEADGSTARDEHVQQDWNSWQAELTSGLSPEVEIEVELEESLTEFDDETANDETANDETANDDDADSDATDEGETAEAEEASNEESSKN